MICYVPKHRCDRIHVTIRYDELSALSRSNIWKNLLTGSRNPIKLDGSWSEEVFETLGELKTNGRDIRNLIRTAYEYARSKKVDLGVSHVVAVLRNNPSITVGEEILEKLEVPVPRKSTGDSISHRDSVSHS